MLVPFAPGGGIDFLARVTAQELSDRLGQQFVIENQTGGGGTIASYTLANAKPDGYTIIFQSSSSAAVVPAVSKNLRYDPIKEFAPVSLVGALPLVLVVNKDLPVTDLEELRRAVAQEPGQVQLRHGRSRDRHPSRHRAVSARHRYANPARAVPRHESGDPGRARGQPLPWSSMPFPRSSAASTAERSGRLAVTANKRSSVLPNVPTMQESGLKDFDFLFWGAIYAPAGHAG